MAVEIPEELREAAQISVLQNGVNLTEDNLQKGYWQLVTLRGQAVVRILENERETAVKIDIGQPEQLIFKLSGTDLDHGRCVKLPTSGSYLVVVPNDLERSEELAGRAPAMPEPVSLQGYRAHFFDLPRNSPSAIAFRDLLGRPSVVGSGPSFELVGAQLYDASEHSGPLFGGAPPKIRAAIESWADVGTIVVGEEGGGRGRWRTSFKPNPAQPEQEVPVNLLDRRAGWYFVRFYNLQDELIDSLDFRFVAELREITTQHSSPFPQPTGHEPTTVELHHDVDCCVTRSLASVEDVTIKRTGNETLLTIPPKPECDRTRWLVGPQRGRQVEIEILAERVWWALSDENEQPPQWRDTCLALAAEDFRATSNRAMWVRLPKPRWTDAIFVGFRPEAKRPFPVKVSERTIVIPLRDFGDSQELTDRTQDHSLKVWVKIDGAPFDAAVGTIAAVPPTKALALDRIDACRLASALTRMRRLTTSGPLRALLKEVRRQYRGPRSTAHQNGEFVKKALCAIVVFRQEAQPFLIPKRVERWASRAPLIRQESPETLRQTWKRYRELDSRSISGARPKDTA